MANVRRDVRWGIAAGVLAGAVLIALGLGLDVLWLVWLGFALALLTLCLWLALGRKRGREEPEDDVSLEEDSRSPRATGGDVEPGGADQHSTTGTSRNDLFVGRVAGADTGAEETTGAEKRSWSKNPPSHDRGRDGEQREH
jgi:hypothetical protein